MANRELDRTLTNPPGTSVRNKRMPLVLLALIVLALSLSVVLVLSNQRQPEVTTPDVVIAEQARTAPQAANEPVVVASAGPAAAVEQPAYYTERYWDMAATSAASSPAAAVEQPAYYTERYWDMAAASAASVSPVTPQPVYSYYTERYWALSRQGD